MPPLLRLATALVLAACSSAGSPDAGTPDAARDVPPDLAADVAAPDVAPDAPPPSRCELAQAARVDTVARLPLGRYAPSVARLADGRVLVTGGFDFARGIQASSLRLDPATGALADAAPLALGRNFASTTALADGRVLVAGGFDNRTGSVTSAELYDPAQDLFEETDTPLRAGREAHTATTLGDGRVLLAGGLQARGLRFLASAELYDPAARGFAATASSLRAARGFHAAAWVPARGVVLLVGGDSGAGELATAERFDPATGAFTFTMGRRARAAKALAAVTLRDGRVLVTGGANTTDHTLADADLYDPATDRFTPVAPMRTRRMAHTLTLLTDGRVLAVGGWSDSSETPASAAPLEVYDPARDAWEALSVQLAQPRHDHVAVVLDDCRVLVVGGQRVTGTGAPAAPVEVEAITVPSRR